MSINHKFLLFCGIYAMFCNATAAHGATPFSQNGMIQNVQNYSGNPFYNSNTYVTTSPKVVYANGPTIKTSDCQAVVSAIIENVCSQRLKCKNTQLSDIRPDVMVALSKLPGGNYSASCVGYIDTAYEQYMRQNESPNMMANADFPTPTGNTNTYRQNAAQQPTGWQAEYNERANELKALQAQTKTTTDTVVATDFPKTFDDLSFAQKNEIKREGYEQYKDAKIYVPLKIIPDDTEKNKTGTAGGTGGSKIDQVAACIKNYGDAEHSAETAWTHSKKANASDLSEKYKAMQSAWVNALASPCTCTNDAGLQKKMGMYEVCNKTNEQKQQWLQEQIQRYKTAMGA